MKLKLLAIPVLALTLFSCGGGTNLSSQLTENEILGKFPSVFKTLNEMKKTRIADMRKEMQTANSPEKAEKLHDKYVALGEENKIEAQEIAEAELEKIIGKTVPFEVLYDHPDFEIRSAMIDAGDSQAGTLTVSVVVGAKRNLKASMNSSIGYLLLDKEGNPIFGGTINPFVSNQIILRKNFPHGLEVPAGDACNWQGSGIMFRCDSYDFTNFFKIVFVK